MRALIDFCPAQANPGGAIAAGELYQLNFTAPLHGELWGEPEARNANRRGLRPP